MASGGCSEAPWRHLEGAWSARKPGLETLEALGRALERLGASLGRSRGAAEVASERRRDVPAASWRAFSSSEEAPGAKRGDMLDLQYPPHENLFFSCPRPRKWAPEQRRNAWWSLPERRRACRSSFERPKWLRGVGTQRKSVEISATQPRQMFKQSILQTCT